MRAARPHGRFPAPYIEMSPILSLAVSALYIHKANNSTMSTENFIITKRDGSEEPFCIDKIKNAIMKACAASGDQLDAEALERIMSHLHFLQRNERGEHSKPSGSGADERRTLQQRQKALYRSTATADTEDRQNGNKKLRFPHPTTATPTTRLPVQSSMRTQMSRTKTSPPSSAKSPKAILSV